MNDDYLWDGSGEPDPEIQKLETTLGRFRHNRPTPDFPEIRAARPRPSQANLWRGGLLIRWAAVAATVVIVAALWFALRRTNHTPPAEAGWDVASLAGTPHVGNKAIAKTGAAGKFAAGQTIETDSLSRASITDEKTGEVEVEPDTRVRMLENSSTRKQLALDHGTIRASIWAPPGEFVVDTPSAVTVDLGCAYTLHVDDSGAGILRTTLGWVGFKLKGRESFIPAGAACATRPGTGPGTPYFEDASEALRSALAKFDFGPDEPEARSAALATILAESRKRDALTLWHLISRVSGEERGEVYDKLAGFVPPPADVTRDGVLQLDQPMLDSWWNELGLGDASLWRTWERSWSRNGSGANP
jgi:FecR protein